MKISKMVADRIAIARTVSSALRTHGPEVAPALEKTLFPKGVPENLTVADFIAALGDCLDVHVTDLGAADAAHTAELADDDPCRMARDDKAAELRNLCLSLREVVTRNYGQPVTKAYGLDVTPPEDPQQLLNMTRHTSLLLKTRLLTEPSRNKSLTLDPIAAAEDLEAHGKALEAALEDVEREKREAQITQSAKDMQMGRWSTVYAGVASAAAALFTLAGRPDLADRVKPTARRRAGTPEEADTSATPTDTPSEAPAPG